MQYIGASASGVIAAPIEKLWEIVSDVTQHPQLAGSGHVQQIEVVTPGGLAQGALFAASQCIRGFNYTAVSQVVAFEPPYHFAWRVGTRQFPGKAQIWQFELAPHADGTLVTNGVALVYAPPGIWPLSQLINMVARNEAETMLPTLRNLANMAGAPPPTDLRTHLSAPASATALLPSPLLQGVLWIAAMGVLLGLVRRGLKKT